MGQNYASVGVTGTNWEYSTDGVTFHCQPTSGGEVISAAATISTNYATATLSGLDAGTPYNLYATCVATSGDTIQSQTSSFTTAAPKPALGLSWLEIPEQMNGDEMGGLTTANLFTHTFYYGSESDSNRNYTVCYDKSKLTTYWVAYPLGSDHLGSTSRTDEWAYVSSSLLSTALQPNIVDGSYSSASSGGTNNYARGHLLPSASRTNSVTMNEQTFLSVNIVPQIHNSFNSGVWSSLESALQSLAKSDDLYIVTGTALQKGSNEEIIGTMEPTYDRSGKEIAVPRYFYKVVLKVNSEDNPTAASAIGFWFTNKAHSGSYDAFAVSVDEIESKTGLNFFPNLPDAVEDAAETNSLWSTFQSF